MLSQAFVYGVVGSMAAFGVVGFAGPRHYLVSDWKIQENESWILTLSLAGLVGLVVHAWNLP